MRRRGRVISNPVKISGVDMTAAVGGSAKISAEATGKVKVTRNAALGIGAGGNVGAEIDVAQTGEAVGSKAVNLAALLVQTTTPAKHAEARA